MNVNSLCYFRENVIIEPLINQWYAWSYLLSPATVPFYIANHHIKLMQSFISAPQLHLSALKNNAMAGSPFMNLDSSKVQQIKTLLDKTIQENVHMLKFVEAYSALDNILAAEATGYSMEPLYMKVPDLLRGYVELNYDLNNHPSVRLIEALLYDSPYYNESSQSLAFSFANGDNRPFVFSTPRLNDSKNFHLQIPFCSEGLDELFRMRFSPKPYAYIKEVLGIKDKDDEHFSSFFTEEPQPVTYEKYEGDGVRVRYFGHACIMLETNEISILIDPLIAYNHGSGVKRFTFSDLPESIDYLLITHNHQDHCMFETLLQLRHKIKNVIVPRSTGGLVDPSLKMILTKIGMKNVREIDEMEEIKVEGGRIIGYPFLGEHGDLTIRSKIAHLVELRGQKILCAADSNNIDPILYRNIHKKFGDIDLLFIGMECDGAPLSWLYGPMLVKPLARKIDQSRRFDGSTFVKAIDIVNILNPKQVYVYAMGAEPWLVFLMSVQYTSESRPIIESNKLVEECRRKGLVSERLYGCKDILLEKKVKAEKASK